MDFSWGQTFEGISPSGNNATEQSLKYLGQNVFCGGEAETFSRNGDFWRWEKKLTVYFLIQFIEMKNKLKLVFL